MNLAPFPVNGCMMRKIHMLAIAAALLVWGPANGETPPVWQPPELELRDTIGEPFLFPEDLRGPTVILFWATWCPYCKALMPHLQSILDEYGDQVAVLALNIREDGDPAAYLAERGYEFRLFPDSNAAAALWGVKGTPGLFLADGSGRVVFSNFSIPKDAYRTSPEDAAGMKHYQRAARKAPIWAAHLRQAIDQALH